MIGNRLLIMMVGSNLLSSASSGIARREGVRSRHDGSHGDPAGGPPRFGTGRARPAVSRTVPARATPRNTRNRATQQNRGPPGPNSRNLRNVPEDHTSDKPHDAHDEDAAARRGRPIFLPPAP